MDAEQSDAAASRGGLRGGVLVRPRSLGEPYGRGTDRGGDSVGCVDGHLARKKKMATPVGAQLDILGDRMIENVYFTYFAVVGMVSLWLPVLFFARGRRRISCAGWR